MMICEYPLGSHVMFVCWHRLKGVLSQIKDCKHSMHEWLSLIVFSWLCVHAEFTLVWCPYDLTDRQCESDEIPGLLTVLRSGSWPHGDTLTRLTLLLMSSFLMRCSLLSFQDLLFTAKDRRILTSVIGSHCDPGCDWHLLMRKCNSV